MKSSYRCNLLAGFLLSLFSITGLHGQSEMRKQEVKSFWLHSNASVSIENKYGDIVIEKWAKDSIRFEISVQVNAKSEENAELLIERIDFEGTNTGNFLTYRTVYNPYKGKVKSFFRDLVQADRGNVSVDYVVYMPSDADLSINNKFGDVFLSDHEGEFRLELSYGDLKAVSLNSRSDIKLSYGKANIKYAKDSKLELRNSELVLKEAANLTINSNGTDLEIDEVNDIDISLSRGDLDLGKADEIRMDGSFAGVTVGHLRWQADLDVRLSSIAIEAVDPGFSRIKVIQQTSDVGINIKDLEFRLDAHMKGGEFSYPNVATKFDKEVIDEKRNERNITGILGQQPASKLVIEGSSGTVRLHF